MLKIDTLDHKSIMETNHVYTGHYVMWLCDMVAYPMAFFCFHMNHARDDWAVSARKIFNVGNIDLFKWSAKNGLQQRYGWLRIILENRIEKINIYSYVAENKTIIFHRWIAQSQRNESRRMILFILCAEGCMFGVRTQAITAKKSTWHSS